jgi:hypothetical protein
VRRVTGLQPLEYHLDVVGRLAEREPESWCAFAAATEAGRSATEAGRSATEAGGSATEAGGSGNPKAEGSADAVHAELLRAAYRLDPASHPRLAAAVTAAATALGVEVPVTVYQLEGDRAANAALLYRRSEAVVVFSGSLLERLTDAELTALLGHELAHHRLWSLDSGRFLVAERMLDALTADARTPAVFLETARRWNLATELFADRGALLACADLYVAVASLVKAATGLSDVDAAAYLRQAAAADPAAGSHGLTHPETVLRAWSLQSWHGERSDSAAVTLLSPRLDLDRLDLADQERLERLTRRLIEAYLAPRWLRSDLVTAHARQFFPDLELPAAPPTEPSPAHEPGSANATGDLERLADSTTESTRRYLSYVLLDLATVDPDLEDRPLAAAQELADRSGFGATFTDLARRELAGPEPARRATRRATRRPSAARPQPALAPEQAR